MMGMAAVALDILVGWCGMASLGHAAFFGVAGYMVAITTTRWDGTPGLPRWPASCWPARLASTIAPLAVRTHVARLRDCDLSAFAPGIWGVATEVVRSDGWIGRDSRPYLGRRSCPRTSRCYDPRVFFLVVTIFADCRSSSWDVPPLMRGPSSGLQLRGVRLSELRLRSLGYNATKPSGRPPSSSRRSRRGVRRALRLLQPIRRDQFLGLAALRSDAVGRRGRRSRFPYGDRSSPDSDSSSCRYWPQTCPNGGP